MEAITGRVRHLDVKSVSSAARCRLEYGMGKHPGGQAIEDLVGLALAARELALVQTPHGSNARRRKPRRKPRVVPVWSVLIGGSSEIIVHAYHSAGTGNRLRRSSARSPFDLAIAAVGPASSAGERIICDYAMDDRDL